MARELAEQRKQEKKEEPPPPLFQKVTLDDLFSQIQQGEMKDLNIIVKADVQGSAEAVKASLEKLTNEEVRVRVIHCAVGAVNESDVMLATTSNAIIVGFNVRPDANAKDTAARNKVDMRMYRVIYDCINEMEAAMKGMLAPKFKEVALGTAEVREVYKITGVGIVAGCYVTEGKVQRNAQVRLVRDGIVIHEGVLHREVQRHQGGRRHRSLRDGADRSVRILEPASLGFKNEKIAAPGAQAMAAVRPWLTLGGLSSMFPSADGKGLRGLWLRLPYFPG